MGYHEDVMRVSCGVLALLALAGCTVSGSGKASKPGWKIYKTEHPQPVPSAPVRSGSIELRITRVYLEEQATVLERLYWKACIRATLVSAEALPAEDLSNSFAIIGKSGKVYPAHIQTHGPGRKTWQHQEHTGKPTHLPANVAGELEFWAQVGDDKTHDELAAFTFRGVRVALDR
jgi:hypothetical protein